MACVEQPVRMAGGGRRRPRWRARSDYFVEADQTHLTLRFEFKTSWNPVFARPVAHR